ncbi:hypothetical protein [Methanobrevibacter sp.]
MRQTYDRQSIQNPSAKLKGSVWVSHELPKLLSDGGWIHNRFCFKLVVLENWKINGQ